MAGYEILFRESVYKDLQAIPKTDLRKILSRIERLADDPQPSQPNPCNRDLATPPF